MWIVVLLAIALVVLFWNYILIGLVLWASVRIVRAFINLTVADSRPNRRPSTRAVQARPAARPVRTRPVAKSVQTRPESKPARELPSPDYLPRWTASRRLDSGREHAQWQKAFDHVVQ
ncbi:MAG: hypothetical protein ABWX69_07060 [Arthrobacter sp.]